ncbi:hypothetical protein ACFFMR_33005 [Micromonospora andamanensis]|uniref:Lipoprotein n=1 Tax=Micromonospora andamanensis TaxID=1287068 RepID=A0ABQ4I2Q5_9ACTN|nr:hypothetical protein [Micromonospora andamanensis]GIJ12158.1 hypothetical protein Van01_53720 [Micromonospora andamanensis]
MRRRYLAVLLTLPLLAACATPAASAGPPAAAPAPEQSYWPGQEELMDAGGTIDTVGPRRWPDSYAGVATDMPAGTLLVYRIPTPGIDAQIRALVPQVRVRMIDVAHSARHLAAWSEQVRADVPWWQRHGVTVYAFYNRFGECVVVEVAEPHRDADRITAHYRPMPVCVEQGYPFVPLTAD